MTTVPTPAEEAAAADRRAARNAMRLAAIANERWGDGDPASAVGTGAALVRADRAVVLIEEPYGLGAALAWARRVGSHSLTVIVDDLGTAGTLARQAGEFSLPIDVLHLDGRDLATAAPVALGGGEGPPDAPDLVALLEAAGLDVVVEGDRLAAEFRGLEVARVVRALDDGEPILEVGVGQYDRTLTALMHGDLDARESIARVVEQLRELRRPDGPNHPLATLVPERWLRSTILDDPTLIGCDELVAAPAAAPRDRLRPRAVAAAAGSRDGDPVVVVTSVGVDVEAPVQAADTRLLLDPEAQLLFVTPARDVLGFTRALIGDLVRPAEIVAVGDDWKS